VGNALFRALGFSPTTGIAADGSICKLVDGGCYDGVITISNTEQVAGNLYYRNGTITSSQYDFYTIVQHETDEILHIGSCVGQCSSAGTTRIAPADLYRDQSNGARSYAVGNNSPLLVPQRWERLLLDWTACTCCSSTTTWRAAGTWAIG
jgi:hypothetical protein